MSEHNAYEAAESLAHAAHEYVDMESAIASGSPDEGTFSLVVKGMAYTVIVRPLRYHETPTPEADLAALREAAWAVVGRLHEGDVGAYVDAALGERIVALRAVLASADSESREETP